MLQVVGIQFFLASPSYLANLFGSWLRLGKICPNEKWKLKITNKNAIRNFSRCGNPIAEPFTPWDIPLFVCFFTTSLIPIELINFVVNHYRKLEYGIRHWLQGGKPTLLRLKIWLSAIIIRLSVIFFVPF